MAKTMYRRQTYCDDIPPNKIVLRNFVLPLVIVLIIFSGIIWALYFIQDSPETVQKKNSKIEAFNALPKETRKLAKDFGAGSSWQDEGQAIMELNEFTTIDSILACERWALPLAMLVAFLMVFIEYCCKKESYYFIADLPFGTTYGWLLLVLCLPVGWPFLLVSRIRMYLYFRNSPPAETESTDNDDADADSTAPEEESDITTITAVTAQHSDAYAALRQKFLGELRDDALAELEDSVQSTQEKIQDYGEAIQCCQRELGRLKASRAKAKDSTKYKLDFDDARRELEQILKMRGVKSVTLAKDYIKVFITVRVRYKSRLYDFGDYTVKFWHDGFCTDLVRSGVREDASSTNPFYLTGNSFCLGEREGTVAQYANEGRIIEALTLIVDSMHSVNDSDQERIPDCFKCISEPKMSRKKRKKRGQK